LQKKLDEHIKPVRLTNRLFHSPACLVGADHDCNPQLERLLRTGKGGPKLRRILELNPKHSILIKLNERLQQDAEPPLLENYGELLFGSALLAEGSELPDAVKFNRSLTELMTQPE